MKFFIFVLNLVIKCNDDRVIERAAGLTYRILLAFFPFLVFLMSLIGFLEFDKEGLFEGLYKVLPGDVSELVAGFVMELGETRSGGLMSTALFFSLYNTNNGFRAAVRCINISLETEERRGILRQIGLGLVLTMLFSIAIIVMLGLVAFGRQIWLVFFPGGNEIMFTVASGASAMIVLIFTTMMIYKLASARRLGFLQVLPGAGFTVLGWVVASALFGFITQNFTQYPAVYGSIAGVFILMLWLNTVAVLLLIGNEINASLVEIRQKK